MEIYRIIKEICLVAIAIFYSNEIHSASISEFLDTKVPRYMNVTKRGEGENGFGSVSQKWTGDDSGNLECLNPGELQCEWVGVINTNGEIIDFDGINFSELFDLAIESTSNSGVLNYNGHQVSYLIIEKTNANEGTVRFEVI